MPVDEKTPLTPEPATADVGDVSLKIGEEQPAASRPGIELPPGRDRLLEPP